MENPQTWGPLEKAIQEAISKWEEARRNEIVGLSLVRTIADALREKGLVKP